MAKKIIVIDTSILCCWLDIPGKETCGSTGDPWDRKRVEMFITEETKKNATFVLPLAAIIETGNHISQAPDKRYECAKLLAEIIKKAVEMESPWAAFAEQNILWSNEPLKDLAEKWPNLAAQRLSIGDATIKDVADFYSKIGIYQVTILTGDEGLKAHEPLIRADKPRRRK